MPSHAEPKFAAGPQDPELESTDGGWDPYVTSLLKGGAPRDDALSDDEDDGAPVMSFSRVEGKRGR
jgi:hypothetical protein